MTHTGDEAEEPFLFVDGNSALGMVLLADHARNALPARYGTLGLPHGELTRHIAYDIGAEGVTRHLAALTGAPAVLSTFSRLLIDPNRGEDDPTLIRQIYDRAIIPGNHPLPEREREERLDRFYRPYHRAVAKAIAAAGRACGHAPFVVSIHTFTPQMQGHRRPWHVGLLWDCDDRAAVRLIRMLAAEDGIVVGDNEPYDGALHGDTMFTHCTVHGIAHVLIEIRQDLVADEAGQAAWARRLAPLLMRVNADPALHVVQYFGTRTGPGA